MNPSLRWLMILSVGILFAFTGRLRAADEPPGSTVVYNNKIHGNIGDEWSKKNMDWTDNAARMFLGRFGSEEVDFTLDELPKHQFIRVSFDLLLIRTWDGSSERWGPDFWKLGVVDGQRLIHTTFSNCGFFSNNNEQAFPDDYEEAVPVDWRNHPGFTGASEKQTLGYRIYFDDRIIDSVYQMNLIFPHTADTVTLRFAGDYDDSWADQTWALDNIKVEAVEAATPLTDEAMQTCWNALGGDDAPESFASIWKMVGSGDQAVEFIEEVFAAEVELEDTLEAPAPNTMHHHRALRVLRLIDSKRSKALQLDLSPRTEKREITLKGPFEKYGCFKPEELGVEETGNLKINYIKFDDGKTTESKKREPITDTLTVPRSRYAY